jgi:hypothetical protein
MELNKAQELTEGLMKHHGLVGWKFRFDNAASRFGLCNYTTRTISQSCKLVALNDEHHVRMNAIHEIAHALAPVGAHHGPAWQRIARSLGHSGARCYDSQVVKTPPKKWRASCSTCNSTFDSNKRNERSACRRCCRGRYNTQYLLQWEPIQTGEIMKKKLGITNVSVRTAAEKKEWAAKLKAAKQAKASTDGKVSIASILEPMLLEGTYNRQELIAAVLAKRPEYKYPGAIVLVMFKKMTAAGRPVAIKDSDKRVVGIDAARLAQVAKRADERVARLDKWAAETTDMVADGFNRLGRFQAAWKAEPKHKRIWA